MMKDKIDAMREHLKNGGTQVQVAPMLYPTPCSLAAQMAGELNLRKGHRVLEPSAGNGNLLRAVMNEGIELKDITAIEIDNNLSYMLSNQYPALNVLHDNFLDINPDDTGMFDRIIMNPPFKNSQDINHVLHALDFLKVDGGLISIVSEGVFFRKSKLYKEFWARIEKCRWLDCQPLLSGTFKNAGTMVNTRLLRIIK